ncbi:MAG: glycosyltransferase family 4 protein [Myxococcota bacterium]|nr:glycosyltransferase family 4 protein [Myxococcota bacterium]
MNSGPTSPTIPTPRLALLGAFPYPYPQGSQVFFTEQAQALQTAGSRPTLFTYGAGRGTPPEDLRLVRSFARLSPRTLKSGPQWGKPLADLGLLASWIAGARRARREGDPFAFALAHNVEAAVVGLMSRRLTGVPTVYVAHTLLREELSAYLPERLEAEADRMGLWIERSIARRADAIITLCPEARGELAPHARGPVALIPPGYSPRPVPSAAEQAQSCRRYGLAVGEYILYSGNLDRYQDLELLAEAAGRLPPEAGPVVIASHAESEPATRDLDPVPGGAVRRIRVQDYAQMRSLIWGARCLVATRKRVGGFPIKLLSYMEAGRPIVAFAGAAPGLVHDESAHLLHRDSGARELATALSALVRDPERSQRLGAGARSQLENQHPWPSVAERSLAFLADPSSADCC